MKFYILITDEQLSTDEDHCSSTDHKLLRKALPKDLFTIDAIRNIDG